MYSEQKYVGSNTNLVTGKLLHRYVVSKKYMMVFIWGNIKEGWLLLDTAIKEFYAYIVTGKRLFDNYGVTNEIK